MQNRSFSPTGCALGQNGNRMKIREKVGQGGFGVSASCEVAMEPLTITSAVSVLPLLSVPAASMDVWPKAPAGGGGTHVHHRILKTIKLTRRAKAKLWFSLAASAVFHSHHSWFMEPAPTFVPGFIGFVWINMSSYGFMGEGVGEKFMNDTDLWKIAASNGRCVWESEPVRLCWLWVMNGEVWFAEAVKKKSAWRTCSRPSEHHLSSYRADTILRSPPLEGRHERNTQSK